MRLRNLLIAAVLPAILLLNGCETMKLDDFKDRSPKLDLYDYFSGSSRAWGLFEDRFGNVRRQFTVDIEGRVENGTLVLEEDFLYDDGERDRRVWTITRDGDDGYVGRAADVVGEARGRVAGNALNWAYEMDLPVGGSTWRVVFDDWMFLQPDGVLINRAKVKKLGLEIGSVTLFFKKP
jgi:hypothetical protein